MEKQEHVGTYIVKEIIYVLECEICKKSIQRTIEQIKSNPQICGCSQERTLYHVWKNMHFRCNNKEDERYGARGIKVCDKWNEYEYFKRDMEQGFAKGLTIDRIDNNGNYCKSNCKWSTPKEQGNNKENNVILTLGDESHNIQEWSDLTGIPYMTIYMRYKRGASVDKCLKKERALKGDA